MMNPRLGFFSILILSAIAPAFMALFRLLVRLVRVLLIAGLIVGAYVVWKSW